MSFSVVPVGSKSCKDASWSNSGVNFVSLTPKMWARPPHDSPVQLRGMGNEKHHSFLGCSRASSTYRTVLLPLLYGWKCP